MTKFVEVLENGIDRLETSIAELTQLVGIKPKIHLLVGEVSNETYVSQLQEECEKFGVSITVHQVTPSTIIDLLDDLVLDLNNKIIIENPSQYSDLSLFLNKVNSLQDIDGLKVTLTELSQMKEPNDFISHPTYSPVSKSTLLLAMLILDKFHEEPTIKGLDVVVVGSGLNDGLPTLTMYNSLGATVHTINASTYKLTKNLLLNQSDMIINFDDLSSNSDSTYSDRKIFINLNEEFKGRLSTLFVLYNAFASQMTHEVIAFNQR